MDALLSPRDNSKRKKYNEQEATSIAFWIEEVIDEDLEFPEDIIASLRSGIDLCRVANEIQPGIVSVIKQDDNVFAHTENIKAYLDACLKLGVSQNDLFEIHDLLQYGDVQQVLRNVVALERAAAARGYVGPKLELVDKCEREDCHNKIEGLQGDVGSLKRQLHDREEDSRELRQENQDLQNKMAAKDEELTQLKAKIQSLETSAAVVNEKYKLATMDLQIVKQDYEQLLRQHEELKMALASNSLNSVYVSNNRASISVARADVKIGTNPHAQHRLSTSDGLKKNSMISFFRKSPSSPELKKLEEMKKFIKKEKQEILKKQEKEKEKEKERGREKKKQENSEGDEDGEHPKLTKALRSLTQTKFAGKHKEKNQTKEKFQQDSKEFSDKLAKNSSTNNMRPTQSAGTIPKDGVASVQTNSRNISPRIGRERSVTAAGIITTFFQKPNSEGGNNTNTNTNATAVSIA